MYLHAAEIAFFAFFILLSGYLAAAEIAIATFGANKIEEMRERKDSRVSAFEKIQKDSNIFFGTIQITINICFVSASILAFLISARVIKQLADNYNLLLTEWGVQAAAITAAIILSSFFIMIFGILIPKAVGFKYAEFIGKSSVGFFLFITRIFKYPVKVITKCSNLLLKPFKEETNFSHTRFSEDEIRIIISEGVKSGAIDKTEQEIIENIFEFNDLRANEVMIPRTEMVSFELVDDVKDIAEEVIQSGHSLIPVYEDSVDNIVGVLHAKDLMKNLINGQKPELRSLIRPAYFIPERKLISEVLKEMQTRGDRLAIVTDEYGGTEGVIAMEDILEEIVGKLGDSGYVEIQEYSRLPDGKYYVLGSMTIDDFNETFNHDLPYSDEYGTVSGFIAEKTGKILNAGEHFEFEGLHFELIKKIRQKMVQFKVYSSETDFTVNKKN